MWKLLADMTPRQLVACIDFRYITDALTPDEAIEHPRASGARRKADREAKLLRVGYPAYTTSVGWMGYSDDGDPRGCAARRSPTGWTALQGEGRRPARRRSRGASALVREAIGPDRTPDDRRQPAVGRRRSDRARRASWRRSTRGGSRSRRARTMCWGMRRLRRRCASSASASRPASTAPTASSSSSCCRRGAIDFCQIDSCRLGGVNENLAVILLAAKFGVPVCPHAGGVGLCEYVQHLSMFDYIAVSGDDGRPRHRVRRPPARAFRGSGRRAPRTLPRADAARLQHHDSRSRRGSRTGILTARSGWSSRT